MFSKEHPFLAFTCHFPLIYNTILQNEKKNYEMPSVEEVLVLVEQGFAASQVENRMTTPMNTDVSVRETYVYD